MKKRLKKQLLEIVELLGEAHEAIARDLEKRDMDSAVGCLLECQNTAITVGQKIEDAEGEGTTSVKALEDYCETVFLIYEQIQNGDKVVSQKVYKQLKKGVIAVINKMRNDIPETKEIVFLPYKASMWDSLESVWKKYSQDTAVETKVIPIPYFDRNADGSFGDKHYEGDQFPDYVPITSYEKYNLEVNHPDEIYIHNPYDDRNFVTSVHPFFYTLNLKKYTDKLVYIPYFVLGEIDPYNKGAIEGIRHFILTPGVLNSDEVIVQSENMRKAYIECLVDYTSEDNRQFLENKIKGTGSPKIEKIKSMTIDDVIIPEEWKKCIYKADGSRKKIIIYNTSVTALLQYSEDMLKKIEDVFRVFQEHKEDVTLLWRPHPLIKATIQSMRPELWGAYEKIVEFYKQKEIGIYDDTADLDRALIIADAYYGDHSSLVTLCQAINMPIMIQNPLVIEEGTDEN